mmetsp:Transcript_39322/g.99869  ORF Transcript_39322/g.99869 Transcript_39322/m.99869 type:complete len:331 (+) Transcript_39322:414-1406(+)
MSFAPSTPVQTRAQHLPPDGRCENVATPRASVFQLVIAVHARRARLAALGKVSILLVALGAIPAAMSSGAVAPQCRAAHTRRGSARGSRGGHHRGSRGGHHRGSRGGSRGGHHRGGGPLIVDDQREGIRVAVQDAEGVAEFRDALPRLRGTLAPHRDELLKRTRLGRGVRIWETVSGHGAVRNAVDHPRDAVGGDVEGIGVVIRAHVERHRDPSPMLLASALQHVRPYLGLRTRLVAHDLKVKLHPRVAARFVVQAAVCRHVERAHDSRPRGCLDGHGVQADADIGAGLHPRPALRPTLPQALHDRRRALHVASVRRICLGPLGVRTIRP